MSRKLVKASIALSTLVIVGAALAANFVLTKTGETNNTITLSYPAQPGADGYRYYAPGAISGESCSGTRVSRTFDPARLSVRFAKVTGGTYCVEAIVLTPVGAAQYPAVTPPPDGDTQPPSAPPNLTFTGISQTGLTFAWGNSTDNVAVTNYRIYRGGVMIGQGPGTSGGFPNSWDDVGLTCNTGYVYGVEAQDAAGNTSVRSAATVTTGSCSGPPPSSASVFLSPAGNDSFACSAPSPCRTLTRGYAAVTSGGTVELADGFYPCATITGSKTVTFQAASAARPWVACTSTHSGASLFFDGASNVTLNNLYVSGIEWNGGSNFRLNNVHVTCQNTSQFQLWGGYCNAKLEGNPVGLVMVGGEVGPTVDNDVGSYPGSSRLFGDALVLDGVTLHDNVNLPGGHSECLMIRGGDPVTIKNSRFLNCRVFSIFVTCYSCVGLGGPPAPDNILIENNYFGPTPQYFSVQVRDTNPPTTIDYRYNTFYKPVDFGPGHGQFVGNIAAHNGACPGSYTYRFNVWGDDIGRTCGDSTNIGVQSQSFTTSGAGYDTSTGHLNSNSIAVGRGNPSDFPSTDFDGQARPIGAVDAGADER